jgi:hypothetical protein
MFLGLTVFESGAPVPVPTPKEAEKNKPVAPAGGHGETGPFFLTDQLDNRFL